MGRSKASPAEQGLPLPPINAALPIQLLRARESVMAWFRPHLQAHGLTDHQWRVLRALAEADREMRDLSAACEVQPPSLSRIVPKLVEQGLVRRDPDPGDQRRIIARLTAAGRELFDTVSAGSGDIYRALLDVVGQERLDGLQAALAELIRLLDGSRKDHVWPGRDGPETPAPPSPAPGRRSHSSGEAARPSSPAPRMPG